MQNKKKTKYTLNVDDSRKSNTKNRTKVNKRIIIVGVIVVIAALLILKMYFLDELKDDKKISSGIEKITGDSDNKAKDDNSKHKKANKNTSNDKSKIKKINWKDFSQDTKAILEIPDVLEYPVVQSDDNSFYLHRGLDKKYKYSGTLFIDYHNNSDFTDDNTIIYGHNMTSGRMFGSLKKYKSKSYMQKHKYFFVHVKGVNGNTDEVLKYEIKNVCVVNLGSKIYTIQFGDNFTQEDYINQYHGLFGNAKVKLLHVPKDHRGFFKGSYKHLYAIYYGPHELLWNTNKAVEDGNYVCSFIVQRSAHSKGYMFVNNCRLKKIEK